jgi:uncharacterized membrane-anchored protein YhcB (DUF1043 family)
MKKDEIKSEFAEVKARLDIYNKELQEHMSRTALLEAGQKAQREYFDNRLDMLEERADKQETAYNGLPRKMLEIVSIAGAVAGLIKLLF